jgi:ribA/ribD-fused uncharacterized protein
MFEAVEAVPGLPGAAGAAAAVDGPIKFYSKLANEYRGFSNFAPSPMVIRGKRYASVEHYFQSMKFVNPMWQEAIRVAPTSARAKQLGASKDYEIRDDWQKIREPIMLEALRAKFKQNAGLLQQLKDTGSRPLIEAGPDAFWGEGRLKNGKNRLGKLLMQVREEMKDVVAAPVAPVAAEAVAAPLSEEAAFAGENGPEEEIAGAAAEPLAAGDEDEEAEQAEDDAEALAEQEVYQKGGAKDDERTIILTSDQRVLLISLRKERVLTSLQTLMKSVAVDCELNYVDNNDGSFRCLNLGDSIGDFAYHPDLQKDIAETEAKFKRPAAAVQAQAAAVQIQAAPVQAQAAAPLAVNAVAEQAVLPEPEGPAVSQIVKLPPAPVAAAATNEEAVEAAAALVKPKPKRINYRKTEYFYQIRKDGTGKPLGYLLFNTTDSELTRPVGYVEANPATGLPKGPVVEPPTE